MNAPKLAHAILPLLGCGWLAFGALAQPATDPADLLLPPLRQPAAIDPPAVLRPRTPTPPPTNAPPNRRAQRPAFAFQHADRILWVGDGLVAQERERGYLETRLTSQDPDLILHFRHLAPTATKSLGALNASENRDGLAPLLQQIAVVQPTVALVAFGTEAVAAGPGGLAAFRSEYTQLLDRLRHSHPTLGTRLILMSPRLPNLGRLAAGDISAAFERTLPLAQAIYDLSTEYGAEFIDLLGWSRFEATQAARRTPPDPALGEGDDRLTPHAYVRMLPALDRGLRWTANVWRFGYMADGSLREGGFGARLLDRQRTAEQVRVTLLEDILPSPNVPGHVDLQPNAKPQCYIQLPGLNPGRYELRVDDQKILVGTETEWARYEIIGEGPSWDQAERLRQAIVQKNQRVSQLWTQATPAGSSSPAEAVRQQLVTDPELLAAEARVQTLKLPVARRYEVVRIGDSPTPPPPTAATNAPAPGAALKPLPAPRPRSTNSNIPPPPPLPPLPKPRS